MQELLSTSPIMSTITNRHQTTSTPLNDDQSNNQQHNQIINNNNNNFIKQETKCNEEHTSSLNDNVESSKAEQNIFNTAYKTAYYNNSIQHQLTNNSSNSVLNHYTNFSVNNLTGIDSASGMTRTNLNWRSTPPSVTSKNDSTSDYYNNQTQYAPKDTNRSSIFSTIASSSSKNDTSISSSEISANNAYDYQFNYKQNLTEPSSTTFSGLLTNENAYANSVYYSYNTNSYASNPNTYNQFQLPATGLQSVNITNGNSNLFRYDSSSSTSLSSSSSASLLNNLSPINLKNKLEQNNDTSKKLKLTTSPTSNSSNDLSSNGANMVMSHFNQLSSSSTSSSSSFTSSPSSLSSASNKNSNSSLSPKTDILITPSVNCSAFTNLSSANTSSKMASNNNTLHQSSNNTSSSSSSSLGVSSTLSNSNFGNTTNQMGSLVVETFEWMKPVKSASNGKTRTKDKYRVVYSESQRLELEKEFRTSQYITIKRKAELSGTLGLSERQIKIWFQNRRAKQRKSNRKSKFENNVSSTTRNGNEFASNLNSFSNGGYSDDQDDYDDMDHDEDDIEESDDELEQQQQQQQDKNNATSFDISKTITNESKICFKSGTKANKMNKFTDKSKAKTNGDVNNRKVCSTTEDNYNLNVNNNSPNVAINQYNFNAPMYQSAQQIELNPISNNLSINSFGYSTNNQYPSFDNPANNTYSSNQFYPANASAVPAHYAGFQQSFQAAQSNQFNHQSYSSSYGNDYSLQNHHYYQNTFNNSNNDYSKQIITSSPLSTTTSSTPSSSLLVSNVLSQYQSI